MKTLVSVVVPVYNEGETVHTAHRAIVDALEPHHAAFDFEIIFVDDGSADDSFEHLSRAASIDTRVRVLKLATNVGSHMAIRAGLAHASGDVACFLAADLQEPPELIPKLLAALVPPVQIVWAVRVMRQDPFVSRVLSSMFYVFARLFVSKNIPPSGASMFMLGQRALMSVRKYTERNLTLEGLFATMGLKQAYVPYDRRTRAVGKSRWTVAKRLKLFADFFVANSYTPLRVMSYVGISVATLGFLYALFIVVNRIFFSAPIEGWSSLMVVVLVTSGIMMTMMGVIGEYLWRALDESRRRPNYIIEAERGFEPGASASGRATERNGGSFPVPAISFAEDASGPIVQ